MMDSRAFSPFHRPYAVLNTFEDDIDIFRPIFGQPSHGFSLSLTLGRQARIYGRQRLGAFL